MITKYRCKECESHNIQVMVWYNPNTGEVGELVDNYGTCWCDNCQKMTKWEDVLTVTPREAKEIILEDDDTDIGGTSIFGETLEEFMESAQIPYTASIEDIDGALIECGIKPVFE